MDFLKRHYEKLILLGMLVLFIGIMLYVVSVAKQVQSISDSDLKLEEKDLRSGLEKKVDPNDKAFQTSLILSEGLSNWQSSSQRQLFSADRKAVDGTYSDLVIAAAISACPHCRYYIPRYYFRNGMKCPACGVELADVPARPKERSRVRTESDTDGDGMPNSYETSKGFDPQDDTDQLMDADTDGFSNLYEFENETDPKVAKSRPPLWYRLRYVAMESVVLPIRLLSISHMNQLDNKSKWILQFSVPKMRKGKIVRNKGKIVEVSSDHYIKDTVKIEENTYRIVDAHYDVRKVGENKYQDHSWVKLVQEVPAGSKVKPDELTVYALKEVLSNDKRLILEDVGVPLNSEADADKKDNGRPKYVVRAGSTITLGNKRIGEETYRLRMVDERLKTALFERPDVTQGDMTKDANGKKMLVTKDSEIPEDLQVKKVVKKVRDGEDDRMRRR